MHVNQIESNTQGKQSESIINYICFLLLNHIFHLKPFTSASPDFSISISSSEPITKLHHKPRPHPSRNHQSKEHGICLDSPIIHSQQVFPSVFIIRAATVPRAQTARPSLQRKESALVYFSVCAIRAGDRGVRTYQAVFINR